MNIFNINKNMKYNYFKWKTALYKVEPDKGWNNWYHISKLFLNGLSSYQYKEINIFKHNIYVSRRIGTLLYTSLRIHPYPGFMSYNRTSKQTNRAYYFVYSDWWNSLFKGWVHQGIWRRLRLGQKMICSFYMSIKGS